MESKGSFYYSTFVILLLVGLFSVFYHTDRHHEEESLGRNQLFVEKDPTPEPEETIESLPSSEKKESEVLENLFARRLLDQFSEATVVDSAELLDENGLLVRKEVLLTNMKYPLIRREIRFEQDSKSNEWIPVEGHAYVADQIMLGLDEGVNLDSLTSLLDRLDLEVLQEFSGGRQFLIRFKGNDVDSVEEAVSALSSRRYVLFVEPNHLRLPTFVPNDSRYDQQWALENSGRFGGKVDADIDAEGAWVWTKGLRSVLVAVTDSGIDRNHPDLASQIYLNPNDPINGVDDDNNGYVDDYYGWNFAGFGLGDNDSSDTTESHGTHVAGTIAASGNNQMGVIGVSPEVSILSVKVLDDLGGFASDFINGLDYSREMGASIINVSLGGSDSSNAERNAINRLEAAGVLLVVASGNDGSNIDVVPDYPAGYLNPNIITVAASDRRDRHENYSGFGTQNVDLNAPGTDIVSTVAGNLYQFYSGTSMAAPHISGVAALVKSVNQSWNASEIKNAILDTVDPIPSAQGKTLTAGRVNAKNAVEFAVRESFYPGGTQVFFKSLVNGKYVAPQPSLNQQLLADSPIRSSRHLYELVEITPGKYAFKSFENGWFISAVNGGAEPLAASSVGVGDWELFQPMAVGSQQYALLAEVNQLYVAAEAAGNQPLIANREAIGGWEVFQIEPMHPIPPGSTVTLQAQANGQFVSVGANQQLVANVSQPGLSSVFQVNSTTDGYFTIKSLQNELYVTAENVGTEPLEANRSIVGDWEKFQILYHSEGKVIIRAKVNGLFVTAEDGGNLPLIANRAGVGGWEVFDFQLLEL